MNCDTDKFLFHIFFFFVCLGFSLTVASKFVSDVFYANARYAKVNDIFDINF
jgi:hypothetical protein